MWMVCYLLCHATSAPPIRWSTTTDLARSTTTLMIVTPLTVDFLASNFLYLWSESSAFAALSWQLSSPVQPARNLCWLSPTALAPYAAHSSCCTCHFLFAWALSGWRNLLLTDHTAQHVHTTQIGRIATCPCGSNTIVVAPLFTINLERSHSNLSNVDLTLAQLNVCWQI